MKSLPLIYTSLILTVILSSFETNFSFEPAALAEYPLRQNNTSEQVKQRQPNRNQLPNSVANAVLRQASQQLRLPVSTLRIVKAEKSVWAYGCERPTFPHPCDRVAVNGWRVTVGRGQNRWVYNTDGNGSLIRLVPTGNSL